MREMAFGFLLVPGTFIGLAVGIATGHPVAGTLIGTGVAAVAAILLAFRAPR